MISASRSRVHSDPLALQRADRCTACARRMVGAPASDSPRQRTFPAATSSAIPAAVAESSGRGWSGRFRRASGMISTIRSRRAKGPCLNTVQPATADLRAHYRRLMNSTRWLGVGMCWTAVVPGDGRALTLDQVAARLAGNTPHQLHEPATLDAVGPPERDSPGGRNTMPAWPDGPSCRRRRTSSPRPRPRTPTTTTTRTRTTSMAAPTMTGGRPASRSSTAPPGRG